MLDAYGGIEGEAVAVTRLWTKARARGGGRYHRGEVERPGREAEWLRHAVDELDRLAPETGEETAWPNGARR